MALTAQGVGACYVSRRITVRARVLDGRLLVDEATDLPDGLDLAVRSRQVLGRGVAPSIVASDAWIVVATGGAPLRIVLRR